MSRRRSRPEQARASAKEGTWRAPLPVPGSRHPCRALKEKAGFSPTSKLAPTIAPGAAWHMLVAENNAGGEVTAPPPHKPGLRLSRLPPAPGIDSPHRQGKREEIRSETWFCPGFHHLWPGTCHVSQLPDDFRADHLFPGTHAFPKPSPFQAAPSSLGLLPSANVVRVRARWSKIPPGVVMELNDSRERAWPCAHRKSGNREDVYLWGCVRPSQRHACRLVTPLCPTAPALASPFPSPSQHWQGSFFLY